MTLKSVKSICTLVSHPSQPGISGPTLSIELTAAKVSEWMGLRESYSCTPYVRDSTARLDRCSHRPGEVDVGCHASAMLLRLSR
jgi:hypothetical protein